MFQKSNQKQTPIKHTIITKTIGTNNERNINKYKPHVKNNTNIYNSQKAKINREKQAKPTKQTKMFKQLWLRIKKQKNTWYN